MMLLGSRARLTFFITSKPPPISCGTRSTSPSRQEPWQALMDPPYFSDTAAMSRLASTHAAHDSSSSSCSQMPTSISVR